MLTYFIYGSLFVTFLCVLIMIIQFVIDRKYRKHVIEFFDEYHYSQLFVLFLFLIPFLNLYILWLESCAMYEFIKEGK